MAGETNVPASYRPTKHRWISPTFERLDSGSNRTVARSGTIDVPPQRAEGHPGLGTNATPRSVVSVKQLQFRRTDQSRVTAQHYLEQRRTGFWGIGDPLIVCDEMPRNQISWKRFSFFCEFTVAYVPGHSRRVGSVDAFQR